MSFNHALSTNNYGPAKLIVATSAANGSHTTLAAALAAASVGDTVFLRDSVTENVTLPAGVNIASWYGGTLNTPSITGTITMTAAGTSNISGIRFVTNSAAAIAVTGSAASILNITNCYLNFTNNTGITFSTSSSSALIHFIDCYGDLGTTGIAYFSHSSAGTLRFENGIFLNTGGSTTANTQSAGSLFIQSVSFLNPITVSSTITGFAATNCGLNGTAINTTALTYGGSVEGTVRDCLIAGGTSSAISISTSLIIYSATVTSSNTNAITGAGTLSYGNITFSSSSGVNVTTQTPLVIFGGGWSRIKTLTAGASTSLDFTSLPTYTVYAFVINSLVIATNAQQLLFRLSNDNGSTFAATGYTAGINYTSYNSATVTNVNSTTSFPLTSNASNGIGISGLIFCTINNASLWGKTQYTSTDSSVAAFGSLGGNGNIVANAFRFLSSSGNLTSGSITIYGLKV